MSKKQTVELNNYLLYAHINKVNGKKYIGITCQTPEHRFGRNGSRYYKCPRFGSAIKHYGWDKFLHEIWKTNLSYEEACYYEQYYINKYHTNDDDHGYNLTSGGDSGSKHSEETKNKMSKAASGSGNSQYGKSHSELHKERIAESVKKTNANKSKKEWIDKFSKMSKRTWLCVETNQTFGSFAEIIMWLYPELTVGSSMFHKRCNALSDCLRNTRPHRKFHNYTFKEII